MKSIHTTTRLIAAGAMALVAAGASTLAAAQTKNDLTTLAGFTIGQSCTALTGQQWVPEQAKGRIEDRSVDEGAGFYRLDYFDHSSPERTMTVNVSCTPEGRAWKINLSLGFKVDGEIRSAAIERAYARFGRPAFYSDLWADQAYRERARKNGKLGSALTAYWSSEPAPWKGSPNTARMSPMCQGKSEELRSICRVTQSFKEEQERAGQLRGVVTNAQFVFDAKGGQEVISTQRIEMVDVAVRAPKDQASAVEQRSLQQERDKRATQNAPKY
ncbi:hypothetical protein [Variovorax sp. Sphag1AA]|uniref:hypothetical protein n=1 Tax=Variovorax sp. Sphag1AA TaxID=2587027 RepID=UPI00160B7DBE|nr:hypothetical protein [Variovorax sp. Sphag1AA]MBB3176357.1 hypothetical protein [Variovorax sp. Sphag1AA]